MKPVQGRPCGISATDLRNVSCHKHGIWGKEKCLIFSAPNYREFPWPVLYIVNALKCRTLGATRW